MVLHGAADVEVATCRLGAKKTKFSIRDCHQCCKLRNGAKRLDVTRAAVIAWRGCKNVGRGMAHHRFHESPRFD